MENEDCERRDNDERKQEPSTEPIDRSFRHIEIIRNRS